MTPYHKTRYHQSEFWGANPRGAWEIFNQAHSSLRSCIKRVFGILKTRWKLLVVILIYSPQDQNRIICTSCVLHNCIRISNILDPAFVIMDRDPNFISPEILVDANCIYLPEVRRLSTSHMTKVRDDITTSLMACRWP